MSNRRRQGIAAAGYRRAYLHSEQWTERRRHWYAVERRISGEVSCWVCNRVPRRSQLHHLVYRFDLTDLGTWGTEKHTDLVCICATCHELLHRLLDRDATIGGHLDRRTASVVARSRIRTLTLALRRSTP